MNKDDIQLLQQATTIPCLDDQLIKRAQDTLATLGDDVILSRVGEENLDAVLAMRAAAIAPAEEAETTAEEAEEDDPSEEGSSEGSSEGDAVDVLDKSADTITVEDLEQATFEELKELAGSLDLKKGGSTADLYNRIGAHLGIVEK